MNKQVSSAEKIGNNLTVNVFYCMKNVKTCQRNKAVAWDLYIGGLNSLCTYSKYIVLNFQSLEISLVKRFGSEFDTKFTCAYRYSVHVSHTCTRV